jgi:hypothetical protein
MSKRYAALPRNASTLSRVIRTERVRCERCFASAVT